MNRLLSTFVVGLAGIQGITLAAEPRPKLVVGIMVDELRTDYLEDLRDMLTNGGFKRLMEQGLYFKDVDFKVVGGDAASASAIIQTGAYPRQNGVTGSKIFDASTKSMRPVFQDNAFIGNFTTETYSPSNLRVTTISDEIMAENKGKSKIHSIAPDASQAIVLSGHSGNSAFWTNEETGRWSTTTYYPNPPVILQNKNYNEPLISRLDTIKWTPLRKGEPYPYVPNDEIKEGFKYSFSRSDKDVFELYKLSPFINSDITKAATEYISELNLGKDPEATDVLNLGFTLAPYPRSGEDNYRYELQDSYLRLDRDIEKLLLALDKYVGKENVLVYLVSSGYVTIPESDKSRYQHPGGIFSVKRAMSLLNAYFSAKYGNGAYVEQYADHQIFLSKDVAEEKNLDIRNLAEDARDFLMKMSGVSEAYTLSDLVSPVSQKIEAQRVSVDPKSSGEVILEFNPGWVVTDDSRFPAETISYKTSAYLTPGFILSPEISPSVVEETVEAVEIAPTIARMLHIRSPNSAMAKPLKFGNLK